jgi:hypothetical protein
LAAAILLAKISFDRISSSFRFASACFAASLAYFSSSSFFFKSCSFSFTNRSFSANSCYFFSAYYLLSASRFSLRSYALFSIKSSSFGFADAKAGPVRCFCAIFPLEGGSLNS